MAKRGSVKIKDVKEKDKRPIRWRKYPHLFLIVCEDEKTEPYYFNEFAKNFPKETLFLKTVGTGRSSKGVVEQSIIERERLAEESNKIVDEVWAVFDRDDAHISPANSQRFKDAFRIAKQANHKVAYSNEVFELWLLLHLKEVSSEKEFPRGGIYKALENKIKNTPGYADFEYKHGDTNIIDIIMKIGLEDKAMTRAKELLKAHSGKAPIDSNPSTTVHLLVKRLRELIEFYSYTPE